MRIRTVIKLKKCMKYEITVPLHAPSAPSVSHTYSYIDLQIK